VVDHNEAKVGALGDYVTVSYDMSNISDNFERNFFK